VQDPHTDVFKKDALTLKSWSTSAIVLLQKERDFDFIFDQIEI